MSRKPIFRHFPRPVAAAAYLIQMRGRDAATLYARARESTLDIQSKWWHDVLVAIQADNPEAPTK